jgi:hypothetical protein
LARVCPEDGAGYLAFSCVGDETCQDGACIGSCQAGVSTCIDKDILRVCTADGKAATAVACPVGSECQNGRCTPLQPKRVCTPRAWECATDSVGKECDLDGMGWVMTPCALGERCSEDRAQGRCVVDPTTALCEAGSNVCFEGNALHCLPDGSGYSVQECPDSAPCVEGLCRGEVCIAGESRCEPIATPSSFRAGVLTCVDGSGWAFTACAPGDECLFDNIAPSDAPTLASWWGAGRPGAPPVPLPSPLTASCQQPDCSPAASYSGAVCGSPSDPGLDPRQYFSRCEGNVPFALNEWVSYRCPEPTECDPNRAQEFALCSSTCLPGDQRCSSKGSGLETCNEAGQWGGDIEPCESGTLCVAANGGGPACVDPECAYFAHQWQPETRGGRCESEHTFRPCGRDGKLGDVDANCRYCNLDPNAVSTPETPKPFFPGRCVGPVGAEPCEVGERSCTSVDQYWECTGPTWSSAELHRCELGTVCFGDPRPGVQQARCGECEPRSARCTDDGEVAYCGSDGKWLGPVECEVGICMWGQRADGSSGYGCRAMCLPGSVTCFSATEYRACAADGSLSDTVSTCAAGKQCRSGGAGPDLGCVECAGPDHAVTSFGFGVPDSRCVGNAISECLANDTWGPARNCPNDTQCHEAESGADGSIYANCQPLSQ